MRTVTLVSLLSILVTWNAAGALAASKPHSVSFGKPITVISTLPDGRDDTSTRVRPLYLDGKLKTFTHGVPHEVTDRMFVVRQAVRMNDALPQEGTIHWNWELGGWLLVDRLTGRLSALGLSDFDSSASQATWYRDYVAYCGISDDGEKNFALVMQIGRRRPLLKQPLEAAGQAARPACMSPVWERRPVRVTFSTGNGHRFTFSPGRKGVELIEEDSAGD